MDLMPTDSPEAMLQCIVARTEDRSLRLYASRGRRRAGRKRQYVLGGTGRPNGGPTFTASSDAEAIAKANRWVEQHLCPEG